jgi:hypothetical protein
MHIAAMKGFALTIVKMLLFGFDWRAQGNSVLDIAVKNCRQKVETVIIDYEKRKRQGATRRPKIALTLLGFHSGSVLW